MTDSASRLKAAPAFAGHAQLFDALPHPVAALDPDLRVVYANPAFERLVGRSAGEKLERLFRLEDSILPVREQKLRARTSGHLPVELALARADGGWALSVQPAARDEHDEAVQRVLLQLSREVVAARSEDEIVGALARAIRALFPGASYCVRVVDPRTYALTSLYAEGKLRDGARQAIALKRSAVEKLNLELAELPADRVAVLDEVPLIFSGAARGFSTPLVASGQLFGVFNVEFPPGDGRDGKAEERTMLRAANHAAAALRNSKLFEEVSYVRRYLESLIENANALILVINPEGRVIVANAAMHRLLGRDRGTLLGAELTTLVSPDDEQRVRHHLVDAIRGGTPAPLEAAMLTDARPVHAAFSTAAVRSPGGDVEGVIAVGQDLTQLRQLEQQVIQAEKLASLGQLAAGVAHEINNPLTTIAIYADALLQKHQAVLDPSRGGDQDLDKIRRILDASDRILKLARDLTSYARPSGDRADPVELGPLLEQAIGFCDHVLKESEVELVRHYAPELPRIPAVKSNLIQVFVNLLTNACHATASGGRVEVVTERTAEGRVAVRIRDTGSGIAAENLAHIFEPFFTTKPAGQGTGLGLSIVQGIVAKHGGQIRVQSELGVGTEFVVDLPAVESIPE
ncbi:MAG: PAS domain-containing protein [Deltaproteobacteria bacterium]|nr:PAS domain-containing protein [Deltaproteobacteria bacterium]